MGIIFSSFNGLEAYPRLRFKAYLNAWNISPLKDLASYGNKRTSVNKRHFISTENMLQNFQGIEQYVDETVVSGVKFEKNDILLANIRPYLRKVWYATFDGAASTDVLVIHTNKQNSLFLKYIIANDKFIDYVMGAAKGCKMPRGDKNFIMDYKVGYPSLPEQQKIANFLSLVDQRIEKQRQLVESLKKYKRGLFLKLYNEADKNIILFKNIYDIASEGGTPSTLDPENYENGKLPFIKIDDLNQHYLTAAKYFITEKGLKKSSAWIVPENSIIYSNGATIGACSINKMPVTTKQGILGIVPKSNFSVEFLYFYFTSSLFKEKIRAITTKGTMDCAYLKDINNIKINIPNFIIQQKIAKVMVNFENLIERTEFALISLQNIKKALLQKMFI